MGVLDYFKPVLSMTTDEVRQVLRDRNPDEYNLIDVRQPKEYEMGHLAGARLIPVGELQQHVQEIDPARPTITY